MMQLKQPLCTELSFLTKLSAVIFIPSFIKLFYPRGKTDGHIVRVQIVLRETIRTGLRCRQEGHTRLTFCRLLCGETARLCGLPRIWLKPHMSSSRLNIRHSWWRLSQGF
jgi:hypothetical protein